MIVGVRVITFSIEHDWVPFLGNVTPGGVHVHHYVWGILVLLVSSYLATAYDRPRWRRMLAIGYGVGAAMTLDVVALWVELDDVDGQSSGRLSVGIVVAGVLRLTAHDLFPFLHA